MHWQQCVGCLLSASLSLVMMLHILWGQGGLLDGFCIQTWSLARILTAVNSKLQALFLGHVVPMVRLLIYRLGLKYRAGF